MTKLSTFDFLIQGFFSKVQGCSKTVAYYVSLKHILNHIHTSDLTRLSDQSAQSHLKDGLFHGM